MKSELTIGKVLKPRGLKGELKIEIYSSDSARFSRLKKLKIDGIEYAVEHISPEGAVGYVTLTGIDTVEKAELLRNKLITANRNDLPKLPDGKYYIVDNGILNLFLIGGETILLENAVALALFRKYGHEQDNERVFFYNDKVEVDFYVPEEELAIQISWSIQDADTPTREVTALQKLPKALPCRRRIILTYNEEEVIEDEYGKIEVLPIWKWLLK